MNLSPANTQFSNIVQTCVLMNLSPANTQFSNIVQTCVLMRRKKGKESWNAFQKRARQSSGRQPTGSDQRQSCFHLRAVAGNDQTAALVCCRRHRPGLSCGDASLPHHLHGNDELAGRHGQDAPRKLLVTQHASSRLHGLRRSRVRKHLYI